MTSRGVAEFNEWRKRVKYLRYQVRYLTPIWPETLQCVTEELVILSELLGLDHDLAELGATLQAHPELGLPGEAQDALLALIAAHRQALETRSLAMGRRLYAEKPGAFARRMVAYWRIWAE
jgi:CHAD domain-containing protein